MLWFEIGLQALTMSLFVSRLSGWNNAAYQRQQDALNAQSGEYLKTVIL
jgi:hypothetical protein